VGEEAPGGGVLPAVRGDTERHCDQGAPRDGAERGVRVRYIRRRGRGGGQGGNASGGV